MNNKHTLQAILHITGADEKVTIHKDLHNTSYQESIIKVTQQEWLRKKGIERDALKGLHEDKASLLLPLFKELGLYSIVEPKKKIYTYTIVLGGEVTAVIERLRFIENKVSQGLVLCDSVVLLTGKRLLVDREKAYLKKVYRMQQKLVYEDDMMLFLFKQPTIAPSLQTHPFYIVDTPCHPSGARPTTNDTIMYWLNKHKPIPGTCLTISTNPLMAYQDAVCKMLLPPSFTSEMVGPLDPRLKQKNTRIALLLDSLARWLYQEYKRSPIQFEHFFLNQ